MLTHLLTLLSVRQSHWVARKMGIYVGMHEWLHGFCPCQVESDMDDEDLDAAA